MKPSILWALIISSTTACNPGGLGIEFNTYCRTDLVALAGGESEDLNCAQLEADLKLTRELLTHDFTLKDGRVLRVLDNEREWEREMYGATVWVSRDALLPKRKPTEKLSGFYDGAQELVQVGSTHEALLHEFLHRYEANRFRAGTSWHEGWDVNGFDEIGEHFAQLILDRIEAEGPP